MGETHEILLIVEFQWRTDRSDGSNGRVGVGEKKLGADRWS